MCCRASSLHNKPKCQQSVPGTAAEQGSLPPTKFLLRVGPPPAFERAANRELESINLSQPRNTLKKPTADMAASHNKTGAYSLTSLPPQNPEPGRPNQQSFQFRGYVAVAVNWGSLLWLSLQHKPYYLQSILLGPLIFGNSRACSRSVTSK